MLFGFGLAHEVNSTAVYAVDGKKQGIGIHYTLAIRLMQYMMG